MNNKNKSLIKSFYHAIVGIKEGFKLERNMIIHFILMITTIICGFLLSISTIEWLICTLLFGFVISLELVNTAIENTVDLCTEKINPKAKMAKDTAAGAVLISAIISVIIGLIIFVPKIVPLINNL